MTLALANLPMLRAEPDARLRWSLSLLAALALHASLGMTLWRWHQLAPPAVAPSSVTLIDLDPAPTLPQQVMPPHPVVEPQPVEKPVEMKLETKPIVKAEPKPRRAVAHPVPVPTPAPAPAPAQAETSPAETASLPPSAAPAAAGTPPNSAVTTFRDQLAAHLARYKHYPRAAQVKGEEGVAVVHFTLDRQGHVLAARIEQSAGHQLLDDEVLALLRRAEPLPQIPETMSATQLEISVPIRFSLR
jgi:protein TonB